MKRLMIALMVFGALSVGCDEETGPPPVVVVNNTAGNNPNNNVTDMSEADMNVPDVDVPDLPPIDDPGFLHGRWEFKKAGSDVVEATLVIQHQANSETASGSWTMANPAGTGSLTQVQWLDNTLTTSWEFRVGNQSTTYGISEARRHQDDNTIRGRWLYSLTGDFGDATLTRID